MNERDCLKSHSLTLDSVLISMLTILGLALKVRDFMLNLRHSQSDEFAHDISKKQIYLSSSSLWVGSLDV